MRKLGDNLNYNIEHSGVREFYGGITFIEFVQ